MKRIVLSGCHGRMGHVVAETVASRSDCVIVAGFDIDSEMKEPFPVLSDPKQFDGNADVLIDFSNPAFLSRLLDFAQSRHVPAVIATTGMSPAQVEQIRTASRNVPIFFSFNMSLGVNLLAGLAKKAAAVLGDSFDIEIVEMHHNQKIDAPSGTALLLADRISSALPEKPEYVYDRHDRHEKRPKNEIGIHSVRGGTIVGEHEVIFAGKDEVLSLRHSAMSKQIFATGAVNAALFLSTQAPGLYDMDDLVSSFAG